MQELEADKVRHIFREQNGVADNIAKEERNWTRYKIPCIFPVPPWCVEVAVDEDRRGTVFVRTFKSLNNSLQGWAEPGLLTPAPMF